MLIGRCCECDGCSECSGVDVTQKQCDATVHPAHCEMEEGASGNIEDAQRDTHCSSLSWQREELSDAPMSGFGREPHSHPQASRSSSTRSGREAGDDQSTIETASMAVTPSAWQGRVATH